jgi:hypothetical protein
MNAQFNVELLGDSVSEVDHLAKLPSSVDMQQREREGGWIESLSGQMQQDRRVLANGVQHDRSVATRRNLAEHKYRLGFEKVEVSLGTRAGQHHWPVYAVAQPTYRYL